MYVSESNVPPSHYAVFVTVRSFNITKWRQKRPKKKKKVQTLQNSSEFLIPLLYDMNNAQSFRCNCTRQRYADDQKKRDTERWFLMGRKYKGLGVLVLNTEQIKTHLPVGQQRVQGEEITRSKLWPWGKWDPIFELTRVEGFSSVASATQVKREMNRLRGDGGHRNQCTDASRKDSVGIKSGPPLSVIGILLGGPARKRCLAHGSKQTLRDGRSGDTAHTN